MKLLAALLGAVLVQQIAANGEGVVASMDTGVSMATGAYEQFVQDVYNNSCTPCKYKSCCPVIVRNCPPKWVGTVVEAYGDRMANAAVIVDWGCTEYNPCGCGCAKGRLCTTQDVGFTWYIRWGDGTFDSGHQEHLGPFQKTHQYPQTCQSRSYDVVVYYCHDAGCDSERCCDSYSRTIDVSTSSGKGIPGIDYTKPLGH